MNILLLGEKSNLLTDTLLSLGHSADIICDKITIETAKKYDFLISFGYRYIIKKDVIDFFPDKIINLHISLLPYNRGADPNLWSYLEDTPKGVTIHYIDENLDTGDIILQKEVQDDIQNDTLKTSYDRLINEIVMLFNNNAENILNGSILSYPQTVNNINYTWGGEYSLHRIKDKNKYLHLIELKMWDTPVKELKGAAYKMKS